MYFHWFCVNHTLLFSFLSVWYGFYSSMLAQSSKEFDCSAGDPGSVPRSGRSPGGGTSNPFWHVVWNIPWTEEDDGLHLWGHRESDTAEPEHRLCCCDSRPGLLFQLQRCPLPPMCPGSFFLLYHRGTCISPFPCFCDFIHLSTHEVLFAINTFCLVSNQLFCFSPRLLIKIILQPPTHSLCPTFSVIFPSCLGVHPSSVFASTSSNCLWAPWGQGKGPSYLCLHQPISTTQFWEPNRIS